VDRPRCYLASPFGFSEAGRAYYHGTLVPALAEVVEVVDPWAITGADEFARAAERGTLATLVLEVGRRNAEAIRGCALLVACLDGPDVDSGTAAEVGYAAALDIRCLGLRTDLRETGERGAIVNLQVQSFIVHSGGLIAASLEDLLEELARH
jgi:nucleoside 2-deoxyribosyltransferase